MSDNKVEHDGCTGCRHFAIELDKVTQGTRCYECRGAHKSSVLKDLYEPMTNGDRIRAMSDYELSRFIYDVSNGNAKISVCEDICKTCDKSDSWCISEIGEWLLLER